MGGGRPTECRGGGQKARVARKVCEREGAEGEGQKKGEEGGEER